MSKRNRTTFPIIPCWILAAVIGMSGDKVLAALLTPGHSVTVHGTFPEQGGTLLASLTQSFTDPSSQFTGTIDSKVIRSAIDLRLIETYQITAFTAARGFYITGLDTSLQYAEPTLPLTVDFYFDEFGPPPTVHFPNTASLPSAYSSVRFSFLNTVPTGHTTSRMFVKPNADIIVGPGNYGAKILVYSVTQQATVEIPFNSFTLIIPEPSTVMLALIAGISWYSLHRSNFAFT